MVITSSVARSNAELQHLTISANRSLSFYSSVCPTLPLPLSSFPPSLMQSLEHFLDRRNILGLGSGGMAVCSLPPSFPSLPLRAAAAAGDSFGKSQILGELFRIILLTSRRTRSA